MSRILALAVLQGAMNDHTVPLTDLSERDRNEARLFCFAGSGEWCDSRRFWLTMADVEEEVFQARVCELEGTARIETRRGKKVEPTPSNWDAERAIQHLRDGGYLPHPAKNKSPLIKILNGAGFTAPRGGPLGWAQVDRLVRANPGDFTG